MSSKTIAVVTGANKGIGFSAVKLLAKNQDIHILLTARNSDLGKQALTKLNNPSNVEFHELDIKSDTSTDVFAEYLKTKFGGLDILINNAAIATKGDDFDESIAHTTIETNYYGTLRVCKKLLPLVRDGGRVVNVSSEAGHLNKVSQKLQDQFSSEKLTIDQLSSLLDKFVSDVGKGTYKEEGWPRSTYAVSKIGVTALTKVLAREEKRNILINCCCPGYCNTDMTSGKGPKSPEEGAESLLHLALLPKDSKLNGKFTSGSRELVW